MADAVNHPEHYNQNGVETIETIKNSMSQEGFRGYLIGNIIKYICRFPFKNGLQDLEKAKWYLDKLIENVKGVEDMFADLVESGDITVTVKGDENEHN